MVSAGGSGLNRAELMHLAMQASGARRKRQAVDWVCCTLVREQQQGEIRAFRRRLHWEGSVLCANGTSGALPTRRDPDSLLRCQGVGSLNEFKKYV